MTVKYNTGYLMENQWFCIFSPKKLWILKVLIAQIQP